LKIGINRRILLTEPCLTAAARRLCNPHLPICPPLRRIPGHLKIGGATMNVEDNFCQLKGEKNMYIIRIGQTILFHQSIKP
jgi:hypothetical protein